MKILRFKHIKPNQLVGLILLALIGTYSKYLMANDSQHSHKLRVATFNVSMEALNYTNNDKKSPITGNELLGALKSNHQQIKNIAEIIQQIQPDILLLNEFDYTGNDNAIKLFISKYLNISQNNQKAINFPYYFQSSVNTGIKTPFDLNDDKKIEQPADTYGFGYFPGHFGMVVLSKYPLDDKAIRTFQYFKWKDMPNALRPIDPQTHKPWYSDEAWQEFRLSSKSHWDIPVTVDGKTIHILASHPTPPVFDGPEDRNGKRNHDEIRFWYDYLSPQLSSYIYDDNQKYGGIEKDTPFIILGDLNASAIEGDAINTGIKSLINHQKIQDPMPSSKGGAEHKLDNPKAKHHTAFWGMRADYVLPSKQGFKIIDSAVYWPIKTSEQYRLIESRHASSDHRLVWLDLELKN